MKIGVFVFTRDFRIVDNTGLFELSKVTDIILPVFIFTTTQLNSTNKYRSIKQIVFMKECLVELNEILKRHNSKLYTFLSTSHHSIIKLLIEHNSLITHVYINEDYTPYSLLREALINKVCKEKNIIFLKFRDHLLVDLNNPNSKKTNGDNYSKFTPFFNKIKNIYDVPLPKKQFSFVSEKMKIPNQVSILTVLEKKKEFNESSTVIGGRLNALRLMKKRKSEYSNYNKMRNNLMYNTSGLSPYIKFGCVSIREVMRHFRNNTSSNNDLIKQLYWREFYYRIAIFNPHVLDTSTIQNYNSKYDAVIWNKENSINFEKWKTGLTGIPLIDASMRELNINGTMHNRSRLVVASFLTKNMFWHWKEGEKYFASKLIDYDPIVNNGNWQWCSGSGVDAQPYFRIFNPFTQSAKYDSDTKYIKTWIPELKNVPSKHIHQWNIYYSEYKTSYPKPFIDVSKSAKKAVQLLDNYLKKNI